MKSKSLNKQRKTPYNTNRQRIKAKGISVQPASELKNIQARTYVEPISNGDDVMLPDTRGDEIVYSIPVDDQKNIDAARMKCSKGFHDRHLLSDDEVRREILKESYKRNLIKDLASSFETVDDDENGNDTSSIDKLICGSGGSAGNRLESLKKNGYFLSHLKKPCRALTLILSICPITFQNGKCETSCKILNIKVERGILKFNFEIITDTRNRLILNNAGQINHYQK